MPSQQRPIVPAQPLYELAKKAKADNDPAILHWIRGVTLSGNPTALRTLGNYLNFRMAEQLARQIPFYTPRPDQLSPDTDTQRLIGFGFVKGTRMPFVMPADDCNQHIGVWGSTGVGKTKLLSMTALQAMRHATVWIIDREKADYRALAAVLPDLVVVDCQQDLAWNPLQVHEPVTPQQAATTFVAVLSKETGLMIGSQSLLTPAVHELYTERSIFSGSNNYPTLNDLRERIAGRKLRGQYRASQYQDTVLNRLNAMLWEAPQTYAYEKGFPIAELANRNVVFELRGINEHHARFLVTHLLSTLFQHRLAAGQRGNWLRTLVIVDEAAWLAPPAGNVEGLGWSPLADILRMGREAGIGLCLASQTTNLNDAVMENTRTKFVFRLGHGNDIQRARSALSLDDDQAGYLSRIGTGECIVGIPQCRPFVIEVPEVIP